MVYQNKYTSIVKLTDNFEINFSNLVIDGIDCSKQMIVRYENR